MDDFPMVRIKWVDAVDVTDWVSIESVDPVCPIIVSLGFLIKDCDTGLSIAMNLDHDDGKVSMVLTIPNHWVISIDHIT